jgi:hypothetical protein
MNKKLSLALALGLAAAATVAQAQADAYSVALSGLVATPNPVAFSGRGGLSYFKTVTLTNYGPGFASNLAATLTRISGTTGDIFPLSDTCTGATLAVGGTCAVRLEFDAGCPYAGSVRYNLVVTSTSMPTLSVPVTGSTQAGICQ